MAYTFDDLKADAMNLFDKAASKTAEAIDYSKNQIDRAQLRARINGKYAELGKLCYNMHESDADETGRMKMVIADIKKLKSKLDDADRAVKSKKPKTCKFCLTENDADAVYCAKCGEKLD